MSIQLTKAKKLHNKILDKTGIGNKIDWLSTTAQKASRAMRASEPSVYYHYYGRYTHPHIRERMYGVHAPVNWQNFNVAKVAHFLQKPENTSKPYLVEPNDNILTIGTMFGATKPSELISRIPDIKEIISSKNFKGILLGADGLADQFRFYFGPDFAQKMWFYPQGRSLPKLTLEQWQVKYADRAETPTRFICLAGDYVIKAVDLLIDAWLAIKNLHKSTLTIVCPNIPSAMMSRISREKSIRVVATAPLDKSLKAQLLSNADVSIGLTHIDGGANVLEGMEYGHPVITNTSHRSVYYANAANGLIIDFPNEYYKYDFFGVVYDGVNEYMSLVDEDKKAGKYNKALFDLSNALCRYIENPNLLRDHSHNSMLAVIKESVSNSNNILLNYYKKAIED